jgi:hypothetical protein
MTKIRGSTRRGWRGRGRETDLQALATVMLEGRAGGMDSLADDGALAAFEGRDTAGADMELLDALRCVGVVQG